MGQCWARADLAFNADGAASFAACQELQVLREETLVDCVPWRFSEEVAGNPVPFLPYGNGTNDEIMLFIKSGCSFFAKQMFCTDKKYARSEPLDESRCREWRICIERESHGLMVQEWQRLSMLRPKNVSDQEADAWRISVGKEFDGITSGKDVYVQ